MILFMKKLFYLAAMLLMLLSCNSVDKAKCDEFQVSMRVYKMYESYFNTLNYGMGNEELTKEYFSESLQKVFSTLGDEELSVLNGLPNIVTGYPITINEEYSISEGDRTNATSEEFYECAKKGGIIPFLFDFNLKQFKSNGRYNSISNAVTLYLVYENGDWFIDDIIYKGDYGVDRREGSLRYNIATAKGN